MKHTNKEVLMQYHAGKSIVTGIWQFVKGFKQQDSLTCTTRAWGPTTLTWRTISFWRRDWSGATATDTSGICNTYVTGWLQDLLTVRCKRPTKRHVTFTEQLLVYFFIVEYRHLSSNANRAKSEGYHSSTWRVSLFHMSPYPTQYWAYFLKSHNISVVA